MYFLDHSGHIFKLPDYNKKPIGYEYDEQDYIFWFEDSNENNRLSINNYYGKIINVLFEVPNVSNINEVSISSLYDIEITCDSENFHLIRAWDFQQSLKNNQSILDYITLENSYKVLSSQNDNDDILILKVTQEDKNYIMIPIYIIGHSKYTGTWLSNILIHISNKFNNDQTWCPITIGGIFNDEYESLIIHGKNMGINLPQDILRAINGTSFYNDRFDEELYNKKIKEYLLNYIGIRGECGNYNSAIQSLNWFGYKGSVELYKLLETDNEFQTQYVRDYFTIQTDIIKAFRFFLNSQFVGLKYKLNIETGENEKQDITKPFWGEGLPLLTNFIDKNIIVNTDEFLSSQQFKYTSTYLNYSINELMFKLSCLKYYYQTYFLPIFIILKDLHIEYKVYAPYNKYLTYSYDHLYEQIIDVQDQECEIIFKDEHNLYFTHQKHYVDEYFNEYSNNRGDILEDKKLIINDTCLYIPIQFKNMDKYYHCLCILYDNDLDKVIYKSNFAFYNHEDTIYKGFVFYPKLIETLKDIKLYTYVNKSYTFFINVNNRWYEYKFISKIHELDIHIGTLEYRYWVNDINYFNQIYHNYQSELENKDENVHIKFEYHDPNQIHENDFELDITNYIKTKDFFDVPTKYFSNFNQIDTINEDEVKFNSYMNDSNFIQLNDIKFGLFNKINNTIKNDINQLVLKHRESINIINNYKYLNNVHMYYLYKEQSTNRYDILKFKRNLSVLCDNILIEKSYIDNEFTFTLLNTGANSSLNTKEDEGEDLNIYSHYLLDHEHISLVQGKTWYFILKNNGYGLYSNAEGLYSYVPKYGEESEKYIGYIYIPIESGHPIDENDNILNNTIQIDQDKFINGEYEYVINSEYNIQNIKIDNDRIKYVTDEYVYNLDFYFTPFFKDEINNKFIEYSKDNNVYDKLYARLDLYYQEIEKKLNIFGYYSTKNNFCENFNTNNGITTCTVHLTDNITIDNVVLYESANYIEYTDRLTNHIVNDLNPSLYWISFDNTNPLNTFENLDIVHNEIPDEDSSYYHYTNYLCKVLTGLKGYYEISIENLGNPNIDINVYVQMHVDIIRNDGQKIECNTASNEYNSFELYGDEQQVILYFTISNFISGQNEFKILPHMYFTTTEDAQVKYKRDEDLVKLYKQFFYKKYTVSLVDDNLQNSTILKEIWDSYIELDNDNYDAYLMHDGDKSITNNKYWYFMFISRNTCDDPKISVNMNKYPKTIKFGKYILKHVSTKQLFLINRMRVKYVKNNIYHFNHNDMIVCSLYNNEMLPHNMNLSSKWSIKPISYGTFTNNIIRANTNTAIISTKDSKVYDKGYYQLQVNYALDNNLINYQTITKKILIK